MYECNNVSKMVIPYNFRQDINLPGISELRLRPNSYLDSNLFVVAYRASGNEADNL